MKIPKFLKQLTLPLFICTILFVKNVKKTTLGQNPISISSLKTKKLHLDGCCISLNFISEVKTWIMVAYANGYMYGNKWCKICQSIQIQIPVPVWTDMNVWPVLSSHEYYLSWETRDPTMVWTKKLIQYQSHYHLDTASLILTYCQWTLNSHINFQSSLCCNWKFNIK